MIKKFLKILAWVILSLFLLAVVSVYAIRTPAVQTWLVKRVTSYLSSELHTRVSLDRVQIEFFRTVSIKNLYIEDLHNDTLLFAGELSSVIDMFTPGEKKIYLSGIDLKNAIFKLQKYPGEKGLNLDFIIDYFSSQEKDTTAKSPFDFNPGEVRLSNTQFVYRDNRYNDYFPGVDFDDIRVTQIDADLDNIRFDGDTIDVNIENISFIEKSGFKIEYLECMARFSPVGMDFQNLLIKTPFTQLQGGLAFSFEHIRDFDDFVEKVHITSHFEDSRLSSNDLAFFAKELKGMNREIFFGGDIRGTINQLRGKNLDIRYAQNSRFRGDVSIVGLPEVDESFFDLVVDDLVTDKRDIETLPEFPFTDNKNLQLPSNFASLGKIRFKGKFTGFLNDFVAYGNINSDLGYISSDINLKIDKQVNKSSYSGHLSADQFDIGKLTGNESILGKTTFRAQLKGSGLTLETVNAGMDGHIASLEFNGYNYQNITVDGQLARQLFRGSLAIAEENLDLDFNGTIDLSSRIPVYDFTTRIKNASLARLNIIKRDPSSRLSTSATINLRGSTIDNLTGSIRLGSTRYAELDHEIELDSLSFFSSIVNNNNLVRLQSDLADLELSGNFRHSTIIPETEKLIKNYIPSFEAQKSESVNVVNAQLELKIKETNEVLNIFYPALQIARGTVIHATSSNTANTFDLHLVSDSIRYDEALFAGVDVQASTQDQSLTISGRSEQIDLSDTLHLYHTSIEGITDRYRSSFTVFAASKDSVENHLQLRGEANYLSSGRILMKLLPSDIVMNAKPWKVEESNSILIDSSVVTLNNLAFYSGDENITLNGVISPRREDKLSLLLKNFNTEILNPFLAIYKFRMSGIATGSGDFDGILSFPGITSDMFIKDLGIYGDTLGDASIHFLFNTKQKLITASALVDKGGIKNIEINGKYFILPVTDSLNFTMVMQKTNLGAFAGYAKDLVSDVRGKASGTLNLAGPVDRLALTGKVRLQQTSFLVNYLNTRYNFSEEVELTKNYIRCRNFTVNDENGSQAIVNGYVYHDYLSNFILKFDIRAKNFQMLNTSASQNELYYGKAYGTGNVRISGPIDLISIDMGIRTEKNTQIFIPLSNPEEISQTSYITFVSSNESKKEPAARDVKFTGIEMDFELDVTPDAEVQLIFDSKIGDIIKGRGKGNIKMEINTQGDFRMFGNYQVTSGDYLFTLQNLVNKKFIINPGGTIQWSGSPYDAEIDLEGVYKLKASLYDLFQDSTLAKRIPVEVYLKLKDNLFNPNINFEIVVPDIDPTAQALVNRYISTEQEKSKQTMSLLVLNRFSKAEGVEYQGTSSSGVGANAAELLSRQLSNWASQISDVVNVGVNYRAADAFSQEEIEVAISTQILNDRVTIDSNVGVSDNKNNTSGIVGDFTAEVKASKDGRLRFKFFNKTINNNILNNYNSPYTQGVGILYRQEFNTLGELFRSHHSGTPKKEEETDPGL